ncbi:HAD family hydrolase [Pseudemcibacter aquimaris]|uniref:HAD family hydrolase n=1 Tax=Pseudemcibacter aquimaris TaxID=2857064 RepID=UPI002012C2E6|nr:HAD family hydrolase [Pseudemcibacter aquimaris]MCC3859702.1 phosphoglycolate phosphatase [Pseudemcibacter aquimaris]WDU60097.1 phosphoglycolate phosphatase [Pseudemcibacter aquimaris]
MLNKKPSAILFDLDGTVADTALDLSATLNHILKKNSRDEIEDHLIRNMVGQGAKALIMKGFSHTGDAPDENWLEELFHEYLDYYLNHISDKTVLFPGILEMLDILKGQNIPLAICTNKNIQLTHALLDDFNIKHYFDAVTCGDSFSYKKPDPRHLFSTCELMNADPNEAIMVGDSINDILAGNSAGMLTVGVTFGYTETPVTELGPDIVIEHFDEMIDAINAHKR